MTAEVIVPEVSPAPIERLNQESSSETHASSLGQQSPEKPVTAAEVAESILKDPEANPTTPHKYDLPEISLVNRYVDEPRSLRVTVIGAGLSGVIAGVLLPAKVPGIQLTILEKNADVVSNLIPINSVKIADYLLKGWHMV